MSCVTPRIHVEQMRAGIHPTAHDDRPRCWARLAVGGESWPCDLVADHAGWAHTSRAADAIWRGSALDAEPVSSGGAS